MVEELNFVPTPTVVDTAMKLARILMAATDLTRKVETLHDTLEKNLYRIKPEVLAELDSPIEQLGKAVERMTEELAKVWV